MFWDPLYSAAGSVTLTFYLVPADYSGTISIGGPAQTAAITTPRQDGNLTFSGTASQNIHLTASNVTISGSTVSILNPNGSTLTSTSIGTSGGNLSGTLGTTGTYTIRVDPQGAATGSMTLTLTDPPAGHLQPARPGVSSGWLAWLLPRAEPGQSHARHGRHPGHRPSAEVALTPKVPLPHFITSARAFWTPGQRNMTGDWTTHEVASPWAQLSPLAAAPGVTALAGQVLQLNGKPLAGVQIAIEGSIVSARTDATGRFILAGLRAGRVVLDVNTPGTGPGSRRYATFDFAVNVARDLRSVLPFTIWLPELDPAHTVAVSSPLRHPLTLTTPRIPGLQVRIPAGSTITAENGKPVTRLSVIPVPADRPPFPLPLGSYFPVYLSVQPAGAYVSRGAQIIYPNYSHLPAGQRVVFWNYDPERRGWYIYGGGAVSPDGRQIIPDPGVRVWRFTGAMISPNPAPPPPPGHCNQGDPVRVSTARSCTRRPT